MSLSFIRGQVKAKLTRFETFLATFEQSDVNIIQLKDRLGKVEEAWQEFDIIQGQIEAASAPDVLDVETEQRDAFESKFFSCTSRAKKVLSDANHGSMLKERPSSNLNVKLPKINLPEFSGSYEDWLQFFEGYNSLIHNNLSLNAIQKFYYLKTCLKGSASQVIHSLEVSEANYLVAYDLLQKRYENKRVIIQSHLKGIFGSPVMRQEAHGLMRNFVDNCQKHLRALRSLGQKVEQWDAVLVYLLAEKLDETTRRGWEMTIKIDQLPTFNEFLEYLSHKAQLLEFCTVKPSKEVKSGSYFKGNVNSLHQQAMTPINKTFDHSAINNAVDCPLCKGRHILFVCQQFLKLTPQNRYQEAKKLKLCINCLRDNHATQECFSPSVCKTCGKRHNTLLHFHYANVESQSNTSSVAINEQAESSGSSKNIIVTHASHVAEDSYYNILSTAIIYLYDSQNRRVRCRCLLDSGSQSSFMTKALVDKLGLRWTKTNAPITGISQSSLKLDSQVNAKFESADTKFSRTHPFLIINKITGRIPQCSFNVSALSIPQDIKLADTQFHISSGVDILLGASVFLRVLKAGQIVLNNDLVLQDTWLGWIISGPIRFIPVEVTNSLLSVHDDDPLRDQLEKFWVLENVKSCNAKISNEELECEMEFRENVRQDETGRYTVRLPLKDNYLNLGDSLQMAINRFRSLESKLNKNSELKREYSEFLNEYERLNHMTEINKSEQANSAVNFYMPHHAVIKASSSTTRLRVVFDASAKTTTNLSLNDVLKIGPKIQGDLFDIIVRMRTHNIVFTADIAKMYRQVLVHPKDRDLQRIVWRNSPDEPLRHYRLNTITYGTASASFLATRTLHEVGLKHQTRLPLASRSVINDFYMDDLITGSDTVENARQLRKEIQSMLASSGFDLRKWNSNSDHLIEPSSNAQETCQAKELLFGSADKVSKTLGIIWDSRTDSFLYKINVARDIDDNKPTKRQILQRLWQAECSWDDVIPDELIAQWLILVDHFEAISKIEVPRHIMVNDHYFIAIHGLSDASESAYGACIYLITTDRNEQTASHLICSKTRVAPIKAISLARLELCAALLLAQLTLRAKESLHLNIDEITYWTDSTIVLSWLKSEPHKWHTFVANRVAEIQSLTENRNWRHVRSIDNPADILSRGADPSQLSLNTLWWHGPGWLCKDQDQWPDTMDVYIKDIPEARKQSPALTFLTQSSIKFSAGLFSRYSTLHKLQRVVAYMLRFIQNCKVVETKLSGCLTAEEIDKAVLRLVKLAQESEFEAEYGALKDSKAISSHSRLLALNPFLDNENIIRVGGRLKNSEVGWEQKHPMVLPGKHLFTKLLIRHYHMKNLHGGNQLILANIRLRYWPLGARNQIRSVLRQCVTCFRVKPFSVNRLMGELPEVRVTPARPFAICGIDYAGPYSTKDGKTRSRVYVKTYICIFVCLVTKAVHIETVTDLTSEAFLNALKRFVSRRGLCKRIYSDNSTTFVGSSNELKKLQKLLSNVNNCHNISNFLSENNIKWDFIPARSPHHGGIWEAAVKSYKHHLKRVMGQAALNLEGFNTLLIQIEAILNSRPLIPLSNDPNDVQSLTPGHFLIGTALTALPQENVLDVASNRLSHYKQLQQMVQRFWDWWSKDYLHTLQQRTKWKVDQANNIAIGTLVLLKEDNTNTLSWPLGRIQQVHPGSDGVVRVVTVKTRSGVYKRAITKICALPIENIG